MKWKDLLELIGELPLFSSALLSTARRSLPELQVQLARWTAMGRLVQIRRGVYALAHPYRKVEPHPFVIANAVSKASYVSLQSALAHHGLIPEAVPTVTSVTTGRSARRKTGLGAFLFRHVRASLLFGYASVEIAPSQSAFVASPEKALLDLAYLTAHAEQRSFVAELRLQGVESIDVRKLRTNAARMGGPKLHAVAERIAEIVREEAS